MITTPEIDRAVAALDEVAEALAALPPAAKAPNNIFTGLAPVRPDTVRAEAARLRALKANITSLVTTEEIR